MLGLMQDWPLRCHRIIDHAAIQHGKRRIITRSVEGPIVETNYAEIRARALKVAQRLVRDGIKEGDRVATLAWNTWRHLESWYGIMGAGAVYHIAVRFLGTASVRSVGVWQALAQFGDRSASRGRN